MRNIFYKINHFLSDIHVGVHMRQSNVDQWFANIGANIELNVGLTVFVCWYINTCLHVHLKQDMLYASISLLSPILINHNNSCPNLLIHLAYCHCMQ